MELYRAHVLVCGGTGCTSSGSQQLMERFEQDEDAFSIVDQSEIMEAMSGVTNTMSLMIRTNRVFLSGNPHIDKV